MAIKVRDLPEIGKRDTGALLHCLECHEDYSAKQGDYFSLSLDHVMTCCGQPLQLVTRHVVYRPVPVDSIGE